MMSTQSRSVEPSISWKTPWKLITIDLMNDLFVFAWFCCVFFFQMVNGILGNYHRGINEANYNFGSQAQYGRYVHFTANKLEWN